MKIIRPIQENDLPSFFHFASSTKLGVTSLPKDIDILKEKLSRSIQAFSPSHEEPHHHTYLFVLEDLETHTLMGTSGIIARTAVEEPVFFYRIEEETRKNELPHVPSRQKMLRPISYTNGPTEICGLYLLPEFRKHDWGRLLSYSRFFFMAAFPRRFDSLVIAEMRGVINEQEESPFWNGLGRHFFQTNLKLALELGIHSKKFVADILPSHPLYYSILPETVQQVIGKAHVHSEAALQLLLKEGFSFSGDIDVFDGGPKISAFTHEISTIRESRVMTIDHLELTLDAPSSLVSNQNLDFRATLTPVLFLPNGKVSITEEAAAALHVKTGDSIRLK